MEKVYVIILASGLGKRTGKNIPKQYMNIGNTTVLEKTLDKFNKNKNIDHIILVVNPDFNQYISESKLSNKFSKILKIVEGGKTRRESSFNGINQIIDKEALALIHDAVRPFVSTKTINNCIDGLTLFDAVYPAIPSADTIIQVDKNIKFVDNIPKRKKMLIGQTPQGFKLSKLRKAHELALKDKNVDNEVTNDCGLIERYNICKIHVVKGNRENIKVTYPEDLKILKRLFIKNTKED